MILALRRDPPSNANLLGRLFSRVIKARLVSDFCHGGIVIDGDLYQANSLHGLHKVPRGSWTPTNWVLLDVQGDDAAALALFKKHEGAQYDWMGLLAFVGLRAGRDGWMYCFEWCWLAMTGSNPTARVTPEKLLTYPLVVRSFARARIINLKDKQ
jgi:hypothetical protein